MSVILIFVDGVGIGDNNSNYNPCLHSIHNIFSPNEYLPFKGKKYALDAKLNVKGLPQSATGQTTIYTGQNAAQLIGKHLFGFPNNKLVELLSSDSIFKKLNSAGYKCKFLNAFRPVFFTSQELFKNIRLSATSEMNRTVGLPFCTLKDIKNKRALYHDYTNSEIIKKGFMLPQYNAEIASSILIKQSEKYELVLYEYFLTDKAGHSKCIKSAIEEINKIESLIYKVACKIHDSETTLVVCSDHGNIEDLRTKSHTLNPSFFGVWSNNNVNRMQSLLDISPLILELIKEKKPIQ